MANTKIIKFIWNELAIDFSLQPKYDGEYNEKIGDGKSYKGVFKTGNEKFPYSMSTLGLIGKNGAGKTSILQALKNFVNIVKLGSISGNDSDETIKYEIEFLINNELYFYGFIYNKEGVLEEYLYLNDKKIFERNVTSKSLVICHYKKFSYLKTVFFRKIIFTEDRLFTTKTEDKDNFIKETKDRLKIPSDDKKIDNLLMGFYKSLYEGWILIADNIDDGLHSCVLNYLLKMFYDDEKYNQNGSQLLFTTHDITIFKYLNLNSIIIVNDIKAEKPITYLIDFEGINEETNRWELIKNYFDGYYDGLPDIVAI